jgi:serine protease inhibitor
MTNLHFTHKNGNCTQAVLKDDAGNVVISPPSVSTLLALVQQGSGGSTKTQLTEVLHLDPEQSRDGYSHLTRNLKVTWWSAY